MILFQLEIKSLFPLVMITTKTERISVINAYEEAYENAKNVLEDPVPRVAFDFIKNQKKILIDCDETRQNLPNKPDMSDVVVLYIETCYL